MVTTGEGKYYSLGLDLELLASFQGTELFHFIQDVQKLLARLLTFPLVTVAALNGSYKYQSQCSCVSIEPLVHVYELTIR